MKIVIIICTLLLLSLLIFRSSFPKFFEGVSILLFRLGFSVLLLYGVHLLVGSMGYAIPVNLFTGTVAATLGIPGIISVVAISILI